MQRRQHLHHKIIDQVQPGNVGKAKGYYHVVFERGFYNKKLMQHGGKCVCMVQNCTLSQQNMSQNQQMLQKLRQCWQQRTYLQLETTPHCCKCVLIINFQQQKRWEKRRKANICVYHFPECYDDFWNKKSQMEHILHTKLKVKLRITPKCHLEISGQGIEYVWW